jgi:hypothetical protein
MDRTLPPKLITVQILHKNNKTLASKLVTSHTSVMSFLRNASADCGKLSLDLQYLPLKYLKIKIGENNNGLGG